MKSDVDAPMHNAMTAIAMTENPGVRASVLVAYFKSRPRSDASPEPRHCCLINLIQLNRTLLLWILDARRIAKSSIHQ